MVSVMQRAHLTAYGTPKRAFPSRGLAHANALVVSLENRDGRVVAYKCPACPNWHVGHPPKVGRGE